MPKFILRFSVLSILCASGAFAQQGTFGQISYGGGWQTTFTLVNTNTQSSASVSLFFYADDGTPLSAPVQGVGNMTSYTFTIPASGAQTVVLPNSGPNFQGWATMTTTGGPVRGQGSFRFQSAAGLISEAVVPLSVPDSVLCIFPFPSSSTVVLVPFDNTTGYVTSLALANTTNASLPITLEFDDQSNTVLRIDNGLNLGALKHTAFVTTVNYPELAGKKGVLRIRPGTSGVQVPGLTPPSVTVLGLLSNPTGTITTIIPITQ